LKLAPSGSGKFVMPCSCMHAVKCFSAAVTGAGVAAGLMWGAVDAGAGVLDVLLVVSVEPALPDPPAPVCAGLAGVVWRLSWASVRSVALSTGRQALSACLRAWTSALVSLEARVRSGTCTPCSRMHASYPASACLSAPDLAVPVPVDVVFEAVDPPLVPVVAPVDVLAVPVAAVVASAEPVCVELLAEEPPHAVNVRLASTRAIASEVNLRTCQA
jgi:hypothetical protein